LVEIPGQKRCFQGKVWFNISPLNIYKFIKCGAFQGEIVILHDNYPGEDEVYVVTVYTGDVAGAGTTANVCLQLHGNVSSSRVNKIRIFSPPRQPVLIDTIFLIAPGPLVVQFRV